MITDTDIHQTISIGLVGVEQEAILSALNALPTKSKTSGLFVHLATFKQTLIELLIVDPDSIDQSGSILSVSDAVILCYSVKDIQTFIGIPELLDTCIRSS